MGTVPAVAQNAPGNDAFVLGTVEVIGAREAAATALVTDTVNAATLGERHRDDLSEALDLVPGVSVQNLGQRRERLISIRGFSSRQVPLFIDGVPVYVPYDGNVDLARFGVDYVSEIVVGKGLASLLYGPNILGGAVNVISRKPTRPLEFSGRVTTEMDDEFDSVEQRVVASLGGIGGNWYGHITVSYSDSDGYRLPADFRRVAVEDGGERENAQSRDTVISAKLGFTPDENSEYSLSYYRQDGEKQDPPYSGTYLRPPRADGVQVRFWRWPYWDKQSVYFVARNAVGDKGTLRWRVFRDSFRNALESYDDAIYTTQSRLYAFHGSNYDDYTYGGSADLEWTWSGAHTTRVASHYRQDVHRESQLAPALPQTRLEIPTYDLAIEHEWQVTAPLALTAAYSHMLQPEQTVQIYNSGPRRFSPVTTDRDAADNAQLIGTYRLHGGHALLAGVSRKTRFPTLKERFSGGLGSVVANPALTAETAQHYEVGYEFKGGNWGTTLSLFQSNVSDAIVSIALPASACSSPPCTQPRNAGEQRNRGVEFSFDYAPTGSLQFNGLVNLIDIDIDPVNNQRIVATGVPKYKYMLSGSWEFVPQWRVRVDAQHEAERYSTSNPLALRPRAGEFTLANAFLRFTPVEKLGVELGVRNATDELYAYDEGYFEAGRTWLGQLDYRF